MIGVSGSDSPLLRQCDICLIVETLENTDMHTPMISRIGPGPAAWRIGATTDRPKISEDEER